jgi:hypothetical protein
MIKRYKLPLMLLGFLVSIACKKVNGPIDMEIIEIETPQPPPPAKPANPNEVPKDAVIYALGRGAGEDLTINGATLKISGSALITIKGGKYKSITIKNLQGTSSKPIFIKNDGQVIVNGLMRTDNINNIIISGDNTPGVNYGIKFQDIAFRAISMNGKMNSITLKNISFKNIGDYTISGEKNNGNALPYTGSTDSRTEKLKILYCQFENAGTISFGGNLNKLTGEDSGLFKDVEIGYNTFINTPNAGTLCSFTNVQDYDIHHNIVNNVNQNNNNHNGIFYMQGNGKFHDNKLTNYQGNSIRMWLYSRGNTASISEIYNNICYNTRKYGAFELQAFDRNMFPGKSTYCNAKVYNNTAGTMNTSKEFEGQMLDLYNTGGTLEFYNNLGFDLNSQKSVRNMINNMSDTKIIKESNNKYSKSPLDAVLDIKTFSSKFQGIGASGI